MNPRNQLPQNIYKDSEDNLHPHLTVLHDLFTNKIYSPEAATKFASAALALDGSLSAQLGQLWHLILQIACQSPEHHDKLVDILADLSHLPDATKPSDDGQDEPLIIYDMQVWKDLPMLGWEIRRHWNYSIPAPGTTTNRERGAAISAMESVNRFVALLVATDEPGFYPLEAWVPAAAAWIEVLGAEIYEWHEVFASGPLVGAPGSGGLLWRGKHGFCKERWRLWRERFGEVVRKQDESERVRRVAGEAELMMREIEDGDVV